MREIKTFKTALRKRDALIKRYKAAEKKSNKLKNQLIKADDLCNHLRRWGDEWKPVFNRSINFSGYED
jgi:type II restriction/modification system DNA methylase subunit YeeA